MVRGDVGGINDTGSPAGALYQHVDLLSDRSACNLLTSDRIHHLMHREVVVLFVLFKNVAHGGELATVGLFGGAVSVGELKIEN